VFRKIIKNSFWILNIIVALLLLCAKGIPLVNPAKFWMMGILGLATPFIAAANVFFIVWWMIFSKWRRMLLSIIVIVLSWNVFSVGLAGKFSTSIQHSTNAPKLSVMSYNVRLMDYYHWSGNKNTRKEMLQFLKKENKDILCLQEFFSSQDSTGIQNVQAIADTCGYEYYAANKNFVTKRGFFGDIIFSKYPIIHQESIELDTTQHTHHFQYADIALASDTFRVFNLHMQSVHFSKEDMAALDQKEIATSTNNTKMEKGKVIIKKLKQSFSKRGLQADVVQQQMKASTLPLIVCGDLNDIPSSYTYFTIKKDLTDAFLEGGVGLGRTYNGISPLLRIDNIFYNKEKLALLQFKNSKNEYSDHYPISAVFEIRN
jgi:endonuclease/exonuclease/phosphatase family metal-dependent hydrolase